MPPGKTNQGMKNAQYLKIVNEEFLTLYCTLYSKNSYQIKSYQIKLPFIPILGIFTHK